MSKKQKIWTGVIIVGLVLIYIFRKNIADTYNNLTGTNTQIPKRTGAGLEDCYCNGVYKGKMRPETCQSKCAGNI